jgi:hypothetical protein
MGMNYRFKSFVAGAGYRYLDFDIDGSSIDELTVRGPYAGVRYLF